MGIWNHETRKGIKRGEEEILTEQRKEGVTNTTWEQGGRGRKGPVRGSKDSKEGRGEGNEENTA